MKPIRIEMTNFGPFKDEVVDFREFNEESLFLISGRTGAGKSSIFDAMTYALFNTTSSDRQVNEIRSTFAGINDSKTKVVFYFEHRDRIYKVMRELDLKPRKKIDRGEGIGTKDASLSVVESVGGLETEKLASKSTPTTQAVTDLLKLSSEQFKQIILLPQYQFSRFLKAPTAEKIPILRQIFGTQIFERFETALMQKWSQAKKEQGDLEQQLDQLYRSQIWSQEAREHFQGQSAKERLSLARDYLATARETYTSESKRYQTSQEAAQKAQEAYNQAQALASKFEELAQKQVQYQKEIVDQQETYQANQNRRAQLEFAASLKDDWQQQKRTQSLLEELNQAISQLVSETEQKQAELVPLQDSLAELADQEEAQEEAYASLSQLNQTLTSVQELSKQEQRLAKLEAQEKSEQASLTDLAKQEQQIQEQMAQLKANLVTEEAIDQAKSQYDWVRNFLTYQLDPLLKTSQDLSQKESQSKAKLTKLETGLEQVSAQLSQTQAKLSEKAHDQNQLMIAKLQSELKPGDPCPVCGSLEHPAVQQQVDTSHLMTLMTQVDDLEKEVAKLSQQLQNQEVTLSYQQDSHDQLLKQADQTKQELLKAQADLEDFLDQSGIDWTQDEPISSSFVTELLDQLQADYETKSQLRESQTQSLSDLEGSLSQLADDQHAINLKLSSLTGQKQTITQTIQTIKQTHPDLKEASYYRQQIQQIQESYQRFRQDQQTKSQTLATIKEELSGLQGQLENQRQHQESEQTRLDSLNQRLEEKLSAPEAQTNQPEEVAAWIADLERGQQEQVSQWLSSYTEKRQLLKTAIEQLESQVKGQDQPDLTASRQQLEEAEAQRNQFLEKVTNAKRDQEQIALLLVDIEALMATSSQQQEAFNQLASLKAIVSGSEKGQEKLKLETYIIQEHLEEILDYANDRYIGILSDQQFEFVLSEGKKGTGQSGLDIAIYNRLNNKELPASSLSGGETFIASLAIALSMSEVVQDASNGALIEALFIDEGFGSLDDQTLSKAIAVLENIAQNRMVGVISHVKEMKDTIQQQLLITKSQDGSSKITNGNDQTLDQAPFQEL